MHVRGGSILPLFTNYTNPNVLCSADIQKQGLEIMIALDNSGNANGFVVFDNGNDLNALSPND